MLLRQLFDHETWTYTYLLADEESGEAVLIDPVIDQPHQFFSGIPDNLPKPGLFMGGDIGLTQEFGKSQDGVENQNCQNHGGVDVLAQ